MRAGRMVTASESNSESFDPTALSVGSCPGHFWYPTKAVAQLRIVGVATDITERKEAEARIQHLNRVYAVLSGINSLIVRARTACSFSTRRAGSRWRTVDFGFAWCGWLDAGCRKLQRSAWAGQSDLLAQLMSDSVATAEPGALADFRGDRPATAADL